jgi:hypothetical protein
LHAKHRRSVRPSEDRRFAADGLHPVDGELHVFGAVSSLPATVTSTRSDCTARVMSAEPPMALAASMQNK